MVPIKILFLQSLKANFDDKIEDKIIGWYFNLSVFSHLTNGRLCMVIYVKTAAHLILSFDWDVYRPKLNANMTFKHFSENLIAKLFNDELGSKSNPLFWD